jgi:hypothetical protein
MLQDTALNTDTALIQTIIPEMIQYADSLFDFNVQADLSGFSKYDTLWVKPSQNNLIPVIKENVVHSGDFRSNTTISESVLIVMILVIIFITGNFLSKGKDEILARIKNINSPDDRFLIPGSYSILFQPAIWAANLVILVFTVKMYNEVIFGNSPDYTDMFVVIRVISFITGFWLFRYLIVWLTGITFFSTHQVRKWLTGIRISATIFAFSTLPLVIIHETGNIIPIWLLFFWLATFWFIPKLIQTGQAIKLFSIKNEGFLYLILYLCTLEIGPIALLINGLFL